MIDLDPEARRVLELAREARTPSEEDKQRVARRIATGLGLSVVAGTAGAAAQGASASMSAGAAGAAKSAGAVALIKWWIAGGAIVATALGGYAAWSSTGARPSTAREPARDPAAAAQVQAPQPSAPADVIEAPAAAVVPVAPAIPEAKLPSHAVHARRRSAAGSTLSAELELLHEAQAAWRARDARGALSLLETHRSRYPRSTLRAEREGLQVLTLCELGRTGEAARVARGLLERSPNSPLRAAIEQSCALK